MGQLTRATSFILFSNILSSPSRAIPSFYQAVGVELDLSAIASAATNAARNGLKMDTYHPQEVGYHIGAAPTGLGHGVSPCG